MNAKLWDGRSARKNTSKEVPTCECFPAGTMTAHPFDHAKDNPMPDVAARVRGGGGWEEISMKACTHRFQANVRLTVYRHGAPEISGVYWRTGAALRLKFARRLEGFAGYKLEAA